MSLAYKSTHGKEVVVKVVYLERHFLLIQRTNQMWVNMRPLLLNQAFLPVLPNTQTHTHTHTLDFCCLRV